MYGQKSNIAMAFQNSFGTSNVDSLYHIEFLEEDVGLTIPELVDESVRGIFDEGETYAGPRTVDGGISINAKGIPLGVLLKAALGNPTTVTSGSLHTHTFKPRTSDFDDYSAEIPLTVLKYLDDGGSASLFYDLNATTLELGVNNGEFMTARIGLTGGSFAQNVNVSPSYNTGKRFTWDQSSVEIDGTANGDLTQLSISLDNAIEPSHTLNGSAYPSRVKRTGWRMTEVSGTIKFVNQDEYQAFIAQSERSMKLTFEGAVEVQSGYNEKVTIDLPAFRYTDNKPTAGGAGQIEVGFSAKAKYDSSSATAIEITLVNTQSAY